jgi:alpha-ribazole phosphatase
VYSDGIIYLDLLRHGETEGGACYRGATDDPLNAVGWEQMWAAVNPDARWDGIVTSPLARCADFARALARQRSIPLRPDERLAEMHFGAWEGRSAAALMETDATALTRFWGDPWHNPPPQGEALAHFQARVLAAWHDLIARHAGQHVLVITHGGVLRVLLCHVLNHPIGKLLDFEVGHAKLLSIRIEQARGRVHCNLTGGAV